MQRLVHILRFGGPYLRRYWRRLVAGIVLGILFGMSNAIFVWATKTLIERLAPGTVSTTHAVANASGLFAWASALKDQVGELLDPWLPLAGRALDWRQVLGGLLLLPVPVAFRGTMGYLSSYCMGWVSERLINDLRIDVLRKLSSLSLDYFNRSTMGDLLTRINGDTAALRRCLTEGLPDLIKEPATLISLLVAACLVDWQLTLMSLAFLVTCVVPLRLLSKKARRASKGATTAGISQASLLVEALSGIRVIKAFGLEEEQVGRFRSYSRQLIHHGMKLVQARELTNPIVEIAAMLGFGTLTVWIVYSQRQVGDMVAFLTSMFLIYAPVKKLSRIQVFFSETSVGVDRLQQIFAEQPSVKEPASPFPLRGFQQALRFESVSFTYQTAPVLCDINLEIPRGFKLGIAGESGSGKSTLINLLFRFYDPTHGRITLDGVDLRAFSTADLRRQMALVSQEIVLFDKTIAENIRCGRPDATQAEVEAAARQANAHEFIVRLPEGYNTRIGERGVTLSGGQRQRLSIARAFVRNAPILVLDEATAALDSQAEAEVQAAIDRLAEHRTVISIAHRLSTLRNSDQVLVLSQGRILEQGSYSALLARQGPFAAMAQRQGIGSLQLAADS